jgi:hypothetical protein
MEKLMKSNFFDVIDVKEFNDAIMLLNDMNYNNQYANDIIEKLSFHESYEDIGDYVPNSPKAIKILEMNKNFELAKTALNELQHKCELIITATYPEEVNIYRHKYYIIKDEYDELEDTFYPILQEKIFYTTKDYSNHTLITDMKELLIPYWCEKHYNENEKDLIGSMITNNHHLNTKILLYEYCDNTNLKFGDVINLFGELNFLMNASFLSDFWGDNFRIKYKDDEFSVSNIILMIERHNELKNLQYVSEDKIIKCPSISYIRLTEMISSGKISIFVEDKI